ncbi:MAG TPA: hydroxymethylbilane synthase [Candidatus Omnitrophota bacterium]|nr:hydroxymethylbilane synthase [Candidatus Omnitrophota bacterium]
MLVRIGTRGSRLALAQAKSVAALLKSKNKGLRARIVIIKTLGDEFQSVELFKRTSVGVFTKAIERALLSRKIDLAVHSLKDLPTELPRGLVLAAVPKREDPRDCLVSKKKYTLSSLPVGASVATGSPRRKRQILRARPDLRLVDVRGNLDTRVGRVLKENKYDAVVLAAAGLRRIGRYLNFAKLIPLDSVMPAVGQAALGLQVRSGDKNLLKAVRRLNHTATERAVGTERAFLKALQGGCRVPVGVSVKNRAGKLHFAAAVFSTRSDAMVSGSITAPADRALSAAQKLARALLKKGAMRFMKEARHGG